MHTEVVIHLMNAYCGVGAKSVAHLMTFENFNYLNVAFISYKLTMWDLMLFSGCHTRGQRLRKKDCYC